MEPALARLSLYDRTPLAPFELSFWQGTDVRIDFAIFKDKALTTLVTDFSNLTNVQLEIHLGKLGGGGLIIAGTPILVAGLNNALTLSQWTAGTHQHGTFTLTAAQMNQTVNYGILDCWCTIFSATTNGGKIVHGAGPFRIHRSRASGTGTPPAPPTLYYTKNEVDALIASGVGSTNLTFSRTSTTVTVLSNTGTDAILPAADATNAGVMASADKVKLDGIDESPYIIVDTEQELNNAIAVGKWAVLRGEGNNGIIPITTTKTISVRGTRILGHGYKAGGTGYYGKLQGAFADLPFASPFPNNFFIVRADDVTFEGFEAEGRPAGNSLSYLSPAIVYLDPTLSSKNTHIRQLKVSKVSAAIAKWGYNGAASHYNLRVQDCNFESFQSYCISIQNNLISAIISGNTFVGRPAGDPLFAACQAITLTAGIYDCVIENNHISDCVRMGMELTSTIITGTTFNPMKRNRISQNTVRNCGSMGISCGFHTDTVISSNVIEDVQYVGIESAGGSELGQSSQLHNCTIESNIIRNVTGSESWVNGISTDSSVRDIIKGNVISNLSSTWDGGTLGFVWNKVRGISAYRSQNVLIDSNQFYNVSGTGIYMQSSDKPYLDSQAVIQNNLFKATTDATDARYAVVIENSLAVVRNNVSYQPSGHVTIKQDFLADSPIAPCVYTGDTAAGPLRQSSSEFFRGSNLQINY